jgi:hypothetical protein
MPRPNLECAQPLVRAACAEHGVDYTETSLLASYRTIHALSQRARAALPRPFRCPLIALYRA